MRSEKDQTTAGKEKCVEIHFRDIPGEQESAPGNPKQKEEKKEVFTKVGGPVLGDVSRCGGSVRVRARSSHGGGWRRWDRFSTADSDKEQPEFTSSSLAAAHNSAISPPAYLFTTVFTNTLRLFSVPALCVYAGRALGQPLCAALHVLAPLMSFVSVILQSNTALCTLRFPGAHQLLDKATLHHMFQTHSTSTKHISSIPPSQVH